MAADTPTVPLVLGGHSFIAQLGSDPKATYDDLLGLVADCLDQGIRWFDTTYKPERIMLGKILADLGRRDEAQIIAWNFFNDFNDTEPCGGPDAYRNEHIESMLCELQTDRIDHLVVHLVGDEAEDARQSTLALSWRDQGIVGRLGTWSPGPDPTGRLGADNPYAFMVQPYNVRTNGAAEAFAAAKALQWQTLACSPFFRGWRLETLIEQADADDPDALRAWAADAMLRYSLFGANVDMLIVAMRRREWVTANVQSARRGPLAENEITHLMAIQPADD